MHAIRAASAALLCLGTLALPAPSAVAADGDGTAPFGFSVLPSTIVAGGRVTLRIDRGDGGCKGDVTIASGIFASVRIAAHRSSATTTVDADVKAGAVHRVTFMCDGVSASTRLTVADTRPATPTPVPDAVPRAVRAGAGGTVAGFDLREVGLGAALVAGSVGAAYRFSRRRTGEDGGA
ncbi:hypothetical protein ACIRPQ_00120 [Streptomyces sp. NPDC101213]|uniref:hypothetical protein n=1 Tax=Streptomyces sp. NPDC101213 TaxID=3366130 RepID=UPI003807A9BF